MKIKIKKAGEKKMCYPMLRNGTLAIRPPRTGNIAQVPLHRLFFRPSIGEEKATIHRA